MDKMKEYNLNEAKQIIGRPMDKIGEIKWKK